MKTLRQFRNIIRESLVGMRRNLDMTVASVVPITFILLVFDFVLLMVLNVEQAVFESGAKLQRIVVFLENNTPQDKLTEAEKEFKTMEGIDKVEFTSKEEALNEMKDHLEGDDYILEGFPENPLPVSFTLRLKSSNDGKRVARETKTIPGIYKVQYYNGLVNNMLRVCREVRYGGTATIGISLLIAIALIHNTIRTTLQNRRREIQIMCYVGANNYYIRGPFLIEGLLFGLLAGVLACVIPYLPYQYSSNRFNPQLLDILGIGLFAPDRKLSMNLFVISASLGMGIGYLGSIIPVTCRLDV